jgi:hypothetical protein
VTWVRFRLGSASLAGLEHAPLPSLREAFAPMFTEPMLMLKLNHYPAQDVSAERAMG